LNTLLENRYKTILKILGVCCALYLFLVGIKGLSIGIKYLGGDFAKTVIATTSNSFVALFIGIISTAIFQSSSTTTSLIVGMVGGGALTLSGAIPMIMGANIGTTITNMIVSIGHINRSNEFRRAFAAATVHDFFNVMAVIILFPLEMIFGILEKSAIGLGNLFFGKVTTDEVFHSPIKIAIKWGSNHLEALSSGNNVLLIVISVLLTFTMLFSIVKILRSLVLNKVEVFFDQYFFRSAITAFSFGVILTILVQSSSITTSTIIPLAGAGVLTLRQIYPFTLGANIGTTVTALLASLTLNVTAMVAAFSHLFFNIFGIILIYLNPLLSDIPMKFAKWIANVAIQNKALPIIYLLIIFFGIPLLIIFLGS
tara:strand:+ start:204 stop:1310 length:1107 start_codon:yes stop_codon:yes gene_type:complete